MTQKWARLVEAESCRAELPCGMKEEEGTIIDEGGFSWRLRVHHLWVLIAATFSLHG